LQSAGFDLETARALYGQLTGMAGSVVYFPNVIALALSMSLVPAISEALALNDQAMVRSRSDLGIKLTMLFALPAAMGLFLLAEPVTVLLFNNAEAGFPLAYLAWSVIPLCLYVSTTGLIQGLGKPVVPALNMFYGGLVKTVIAWFLTAVPALNVGGAALASVIGLSLAAFLNLRQVGLLTGWQPNLKQMVLLPSLATVAMGAAVLGIDWGTRLIFSAFLSSGQVNALAVSGAIVLGVIVYGLILLFSGVLKQDELKMVPYLGKILSALAGRLAGKQ